MDNDKQEVVCKSFQRLRMDLRIDLYNSKVTIRQPSTEPFEDLCYNLCGRTAATTCSAEDTLTQVM